MTLLSVLRTSAMKELAFTAIATSRGVSHTHCMIHQESTEDLKMADLNSTAFTSLGSLKCLQRLLKCVGVSDERFDVHTARGHHLQGSRVAARIINNNIVYRAFE